MTTPTQVYNKPVRLADRSPRPALHLRRGATLLPRDSDAGSGAGAPPQATDELSKIIARLNLNPFGKD